MDVVFVSPLEEDWFSMHLCQCSYDGSCDGTGSVKQRSLQQEKPILKHNLEALLL